MNPQKKFLNKTAHFGMCASLFCLQGILGFSAFGQSAKSFRADHMDTILYGVAYYPEYMPYDRVDKDVQLMQKAGITVVRIGQSSWGLWPPQEGKIAYSRSDRVVDKLHAPQIPILL